MKKKFHSIIYLHIHQFGRVCCHNVDPYFVHKQKMTSPFLSKQKCKDLVHQKHILLTLKYECCFVILSIRTFTHPSYIVDIFLFFLVKLFFSLVSKILCFRIKSINQIIVRSIRMESKTKQKKNSN